MLFVSNIVGQQTPAPSTPATKPSPAPTAKKPQIPSAKATQPAARAHSFAARNPAAKTPSAVTLRTDKEKASYAIGMSIGKSMQRDGAEVDPDILARGLKDVLAGKKSLLTDDEAKTALGALQNDLRSKQEAKMVAASEANKKAGDDFLAANKTKEGVVTLPSGLQYKILKPGNGPKPTIEDSVVCNYKGSLLNGTEFDSSYKRGQPASFPVGQIIKGWSEALQLMPVGSTWQLFVPPDLAYGPRGSAPVIGPSETLVFEVELLSIQPKGQAADAPAASAQPNDSDAPKSTGAPKVADTPKGADAAQPTDASKSGIDSPKPADATKGTAAPKDPTKKP
ncbi:MAG: hypothetical protein NVS9B4_03240 [Candidatus Acidiferrum sp.]